MLSKTTRRNFASELIASGGPDDVALVDHTHGTPITFDTLSRRVDHLAGVLDLAERSLVVIAASNSATFVETYLAVVRGGHVPLLATSHAEQLAETWDVDAIVRPDEPSQLVERRHVTARHGLHPDLALLLSTSGSTGAPKLVRLSHENLLSNASSIASYLELGPTDCGVTTLPLHYCYGLSILHSHLRAGATTVVTQASVVDPCFATAVADHGVTNVSGVPHTFELLHRAGPERLRSDTLRFVTVAGGRMGSDRVAAWRDLTASWGVGFFVMYGQTEATARMAYLPPAVCARRPSAIGVPIPDGHLELRPVVGMPDDVGELVYRGPNVMLGYATEPLDLHLGATVDELATGDLARFHADDGVFEIVGRRSRFVKPFGVRVDLDEVERHLEHVGVDAAVTGTDERILIRAPGAACSTVHRIVTELTGLPTTAVLVSSTGQIPRTDSAKVDHAALLAALSDEFADSTDNERIASVAAIYQAVLGPVEVSAASSFVSLGGDSLSYIECSVRLEEFLGHLPDNWHLTAVADLEPGARSRWRSRLDTSALLRAVGICTVVSTHMSLLYFPGGAHLLLAIAGYNLSRFQLSIDGTTERARAAVRTVARVVVPTTMWIAFCMLVFGAYGFGTLLLVNNYTGSPEHRGGAWHFWFIEAFVQLTVLATLLVAVPALRRLERAAPYLFALGVLAVTLAFRYRWIEIDESVNLRFRTHGVAWFFALGWLAHQSTTRGKQLLTSMLCVVTVSGFFYRPEREWFIIAGLVALIWLPTMPLPRVALRLVALVAASSMWIYITHFRAFPMLDRELPLVLAYVLTLVVGIAAWRAYEAAVSVPNRIRRYTAAPRALPTTRLTANANNVNDT